MTTAFSASIAAGIVAAVFSSASAAAESQYIDRNARDEWILSAVNNNKADWSKSIHGQLHLQRFADGFYIVTKEMKWRPPPYGAYSGFAPVVVPQGFVTDLASIPKPFWSIAPRDGDYVRAAVIHDYLYWVQDRGRDESDAIFKESMEFVNTPLVIRDPIYHAVRTFGESAWNENARLKQSGDIRIIKSFPGDEDNYTWKQWKEKISAVK